MILIVSCSKDIATISPVVDALRKRKIEVLCYFADDVAQGKARMSYTLSPAGVATFVYNGMLFRSDEIKAAWYRRPNYFSSAEPDTVKMLYLDGQRKDTQTHMWRSIASDRWINAPDRIAQTNDKCLQMQLAQAEGMAIPKTIISNDWNAIFDTLQGEEVILKMPYGILYEEQGSRFLASTIIKRTDRQKLAHTNPFPGLWQEYIPKKREWRVTVVGDTVFPVAVYTKDTARDDWRKHQFKKGLVTFKKATLPTKVAQQCISILRKMGLGFGAFDLIETPEGEFVFLEVNGNGQYQWLEDALGLGVAEAIADRLAAIQRDSLI